MIEIKRLSAEHIAEVACIEELCFSIPWSEKSLEMLLKSGNVGIVILCDGKVVAYGGMLTVLDEGQITNIATHPEYRRKGFARMIMHEIDRYAEENDIAFLSLEVREKNLAAISLYSSCGWNMSGVRKNFYVAPLDNAIVMTKVFER